MSAMKTIWTSLLVACALATGIDTASASGAPALTQVISGSVHDALFAVEFDHRQGLAVGAAGAIYDTADGGKTWTAVTPAPTTLGLLGVASRDGRSIAVGQKGLVLTRESGKSWQSVESGTQERLFSVSMNSKGQAVAVGSFGTVLRSTDAGQSWKDAAPDWTAYTTDGQQPHLYAASIDEAGDITVAGEFGLILRQRVQGNAWQLLNKGDASLFAMEFEADGNAWAAGQSGYVLHSKNNGMSWQVVDVGSTAILLSIHAADNGHVLMTGMRDAVASRDGGNSWQHLVDPLVTSSWYAGIAQVEGEMPIAVGNNGQIVRIDD
jgi:photosystem II stability/assembly factor-like uncharacterized protein